jgi:hypothetical protein
MKKSSGFESIPLDLMSDDKAVREVIRDFFDESPLAENQKPIYGEADNITKAGCLALARISNEVGGPNKGYVVWNTWRKAFPARGDFDLSGDHDQIRWRNISNFSGVDFDHSKLNFSKFIFDNGADFSSVSYLLDANFQNATWGDSANFRRTQWGSANFVNCRWGNDCNFSEAQWGDVASFMGAQWGDRANFLACQWGDKVSFDGATWGHFSRFVGALWGDGASFNGARWGDYSNFTGAGWGHLAFFMFCRWGDGARFKGAYWGEQSDFECSTWGLGANFVGLSWSQLKHFIKDDKVWERIKKTAESHGLSPDEFVSMRFRGTTFESVDFSNRKFKGETDFGLLERNLKVQIPQRNENDEVLINQEKILWQLAPTHQRHVTFASAPKFHSCELHQDTSFEGAQFPPASGSEEAARAYRTLKLAFSKQQAIREEQRFFRLEMEEETLRETGLKRWLFKAYKYTSDYGFSITMPLLVLAILWLVFAQIYGSYTGVEHCFSWAVNCKIQSDWLNYSLQQALPLPGFDKLKPAMEDVSVALLFIHKTLSLAALFLVGLALRNLFKLK